jgi:nitrate/nitrite transporter NarK
MVECSSSPGRRSVSSKAGIHSLTHPDVVINLSRTGCSFSAWYSFSPLSKSIRADLKITNEQWLNSNIIALVAGMVMRAVVGPCCDRFGPRKTSKFTVQGRMDVPVPELTIMFCAVTGVLIAAAIPCALAGTITNYAGLMLIRFFVGIAGASFVPTLNWCTMFYDKNVVGTGKSPEFPSEILDARPDLLLSPCSQRVRWWMGKRW